MRLKIKKTNEDGSEGFDTVELSNGAMQLDGHTFNLDMSPRDVHTETALTNFATGFSQEGFIWRNVMPTLLVNKQSDTYYNWNREDAYEEGDRNNNARMGDVGEDSPRLSTDRYEVALRARSFFISSEALSNADSILNLQLAHMNRSMTILDIDSEARSAALLQSPSSFDTSVTKVLDVNTTWLNTNTNAPGPNSNPIKDLLDLGVASLIPTTKWIMNPIVFNAFIMHPEVQKYFIQKTGTPSLPTNGQLEELFSGIFGVAPIQIARARKLSGSAHPFIWNNSVTGVHVPRGTPTGMDTTTAYRFRWSGAGNSQLGGFSARDGYFVRTIPMERGVLGGMKTFIFTYDTEKLVSTFGGALITGAVGAF